MDYDETDLIRRKKPAPEKKRQRGCPGNDGGEHVYDWSDKIYRWSEGSSPFNRWECIGCGKRGGRSTRKGPSIRFVRESKVSS